MNVTVAQYRCLGSFHDAENELFKIFENCHAAGCRVQARLGPDRGGFREIVARRERLDNEIYALSHH